MTKHFSEYNKFDVMAETGGVSAPVNEKVYEEIDEDALKAKMDELRKNFDPEMAQDMAALHGINMEDELRALAIHEMSKQ